MIREKSMNGIEPLPPPVIVGGLPITPHGYLRHEVNYSSRLFSWKIVGRVITWPPTLGSDSNSRCVHHDYQSENRCLPDSSFLLHAWGSITNIPKPQRIVVVALHTAFYFTSSSRWKFWEQNVGRTWTFMGFQPHPLTARLPFHHLHLFSYIVQ